jgi:hypothetical protein
VEAPDKRAVSLAALFRFLRQPSSPKAPRLVPKSGSAAGKGVTAVAIMSGVAVVADVRVPKAQDPYPPDPDDTRQGFPSPLDWQPEVPGVQPEPPPTRVAEPKNKPPELPLKMVSVDAVGVKVMLEGDADKSDPVNVADVPDPDNDNDHDTRVSEVTLQESQMSTMSPVTPLAPIE